MSAPNRGPIILIPPWWTSFSPDLEVTRRLSDKPGHCTPAMPYLFCLPIAAFSARADSGRCHAGQHAEWDA